MLAPAVSVSIGLGFVVVGGINVWLVLQAWSQGTTEKAKARMPKIDPCVSYLVQPNYIRRPLWSAQPELDPALG